MNTATELRNKLRSIDHKGYPAYKDLKGQYNFGDYVLSIDHVQGDPFASPSRLSVRVEKAKAGFPAAYYDTKAKRITLQDHLTRLFGRQVAGGSFQAKGSGKSGLLSVSRCGQQVLERTAMRVKDGDLILRFEAGFPANGRTINARELEKMLFDILPDCVRRSLYYGKIDKEKLRQAICLCEDQQYIRQCLTERKLCAFIADGSVLPRESGVSERPMKNGVPFRSPESLRITLDLPNKGAVSGMGIPQGITLFVGGGYHGKSTILQALQNGVYDHIAGDGRELVITDASAFKLRAEDGRSVTGVDISPFISRVRGMYEDLGVSSVIVAGSSGAFFHMADTIIQMKEYVPIDITQKAKEAAAACEDMGAEDADDARKFPPFNRKRCPGPDMALRKEDRIKMKAMGTSEISICKENVELRYLEQLKDQEQSMALAYLLKYAQLKMMDGRKDLRQIGDLLEEQLDGSGLESLFERGDVSSQLARPRKQEILACINRYRKLKI